MVNTKQLDIDVQYNAGALLTAPLDELARRFRPALFQFIYYRVSRDTDLAEDLTQDVFRQTLLHLQSQELRSEFWGLLKNIAKNLIIDYYRHSGRRRLKVQSSLLMNMQSRPLGDGELTPPENQDALARAISDLPPDYRVVLECKYLGNMSVREIALRLGRSEKAAESLLSKARAKLKNQLWREAKGENDE